MATATKALSTLQASASNSAGSSTPSTLGTGSADLTTALGGVVTAKITNGGTGPTVGCDFVVYVSGDGTNWKEFSRQTAPTTASGVFSFAVEIPAAVMYVCVQFTGNTGAAVTVEAFIQKLSSIG